MNREKMGTALADAFDETVRRTIVHVLDEAYQEAGIRYDEEIGCNGFTFGTDLYQFAKFRFQGNGERAAAPIMLGETSSELELRLRVGHFTVACHRVGGSASEDIADCFPSSSGGPGRLARLNAVQLELDLGDGGGQPLPANVVVAHLGNPDHGLEAVYLAIPFGVSEAGKINGWAYTELMWRWDGEGAVTHTLADLPPAVPIPDVEVELRRNVAENEDARS